MAVRVGSSLRSWCILAAKIILLLLVVAAVWSTLRSAWEDLRDESWSVSPLAVIGSAVCYVVGLLPAGCFWWWIMGRMVKRPPWAAAVAAYFVGHLGKYVPGKALVVLLRVGLIRGFGVPPGVATAAVFVETLSMMAIGGVVAAVTQLMLVQNMQIATVAAGLAILSGLPVLPPVMNRLLAWMAARKAKKQRPDAPQPDSDLQPPTEKATPGQYGWSDLALAAGLMLAVWLLLGASLKLLLGGMTVGGEPVAASWTTCVSATSFSTVAGFLSLLPGGIGVRDLSLLEILSQSMSPAAALVASLLLRVIWLVSEVVVSVILYLAVLQNRSR